MNNVQIYEIKSLLEKELQAFDYKLEYTTMYWNKFMQSGNAVNHTRKIVYTMPRTTPECLVGILHELGHVIDREKYNKVRNRNKKIIRLYDELIAWCYAIPYLFKYKLSKKLFVKKMCKALYTYIKF